MISKHTFVVVVGALATMTLIACQKSFVMTCDKSSIEGCKDNAETKKINTAQGEFEVSMVRKSIYASPMSGPAVDMAIRISSPTLNPREISFSVEAGMNSQIRSQGNEPQMMAVARCADASCTSVDVGVYFQFQDGVKVYAARLSTSTDANGATTTVSQMATLRAVGGSVTMGDPTSALMATYPNP